MDIVVGILVSKGFKKLKAVNVAYDAANETRDLLKYVDDAVDTEVLRTEVGKWMKNF